MHNLTIDLELISVGDIAILQIDSISDDEEINIDAYGYVGQEVNIDIIPANNQNVTLKAFTFLSHNTTILKFAQKPYEIRIVNMVFKGPVIYADGAKIENLNIYMGAQSIPINLLWAQNITVKEEWEDEDSSKVRLLLKGVNVIPGCGEFALKDHSSLLQMKKDFPNIKWISPVVAWFATDADIRKTAICPAIEGVEAWRSHMDWQVGQYNRSNAHVISKDSTGVVNYGGTINDASVVDYLEKAKTLGFNIMFYPLLMVDEPGKPWRGHMTGSVDAIDHFYKEYRKFILHYVHLVKGKVDAFLIGSELKGITSIVTADKQFPFVRKLIELAAEVKVILGPRVKISYAADWSEYHTADGCLRPLDELWASRDIDFVGIDAYFPLTHLTRSNIPFQEIKDGWNSGEGIDFYFNDGTKVPLKPDEKWVHWKDIAYWWSSEHWCLDGSSKESFKTAWIPKMKPIWFTEFGFPSIDKAPNKPNVFFNPKAKDGGVPTFSNEKADFAIQRRALHATLDYWKDQVFVENMFAWCFDSRGSGWTICTQTYDKSKYYYDDHELWQYGHWIDSKITSARNLVVYTREIVETLLSLSIEGPWSVTLDNLHMKGVAIIALNVDEVQIRYGVLAIKEFHSKSKNLSIIGNVDLEAEKLKIEATKIIGKAFVAMVDSSYDIGEKTHITEHNEIAYFAHIKVKEMVLRTTEMLDLEALNIEVARLYIIAKSINFPCLVTTDKKHDQFRGTEDWLTGASRKSDEHTRTQTPYPVQIKASEKAYIKVEDSFLAEGMKLKTQKLHMEAGTYHFTGVALDDAYSKDSKSKGGMFSKGTVRNEVSHAVSIEGVSIMVGDVAYLISQGKIWLEASSISARELNISADKIELEALVGNNFHQLHVRKAYARIALTAGGGELSVGVEGVVKHHSERHYREYAVPSALFGHDVLRLHANELHQVSSFLGGKKGEIDVPIWSVGNLALHESHSAHDLELRARAAIGIRENVTPVARSVQALTAAAGQLGDNELAGVNTALAAYSTVRAGTYLVQGGLVTAGPMVSVDVAISAAKMTRTSYAPNVVEFEALESTATVPDMSVPEDEVSTWSYGVSAGISNSGWNAFGQVEQDGVRMGLGYSHAWESGAGPAVFGDEIRVIAGSGDDILDATWASMDARRFQQIWGRASLSSVVAETVVNVQQFLGIEPGLALGVAAGDVVEEDEEDDQVSLEVMLSRKPEVLDINPEIKAADAEHCLTIIYEPGVAEVKDKEGNVVSYKLDPKHIGHYYVGIGRFEAGEVCLVDKKAGMNPEATAPIHRGEILDEHDRYEIAHRAERQHGVGNLIIEKAIPLSAQQKSVVSEFIETRERNPGAYAVLYNDCISFSQEVLDLVGIQGVKVGDAVRPEPQHSFTFAGSSARHRGIDGMIVHALSKEDAAKVHNVPIDRLVSITNGSIDILEFRIMPFYEYLKIQGKRGNR